MKKTSVILLLIQLSTIACSRATNDRTVQGPVCPDAWPEEVKAYNYAIGTQTIGPSYGFTQESRLVETARQILSMGSNIMKTTLSLEQGFTYCHEMLEKNPDYRTIMGMDFRYYFFWVYSSADTAWRDGFSDAEKEIEYDNMYRLADYLLKTFVGTGKEFFLGHWEGDWHLTEMDGNLQTVDPDRIKGMINWYKTRQKAIDDAEEANPGSDVKVWHYCEVNRVLDAIDRGYDRIVNKVLPYTGVDYVSYSSYDAIGGDSYETLSSTLHRALDAIEAALVPKDCISGKRVFIGEYGFSNKSVGQGEQDARSRMVMKASLEWGCPFVLYWEMYNNEVDDSGQQVGFWLINDSGVRQTVYYTHVNFYDKMKCWVYKYIQQHGDWPSREEFNSEACKIL